MRWAILALAVAFLSSCEAFGKMAVATAEQHRKDRAIQLLGMDLENQPLWQNLNSFSVRNADQNWTLVEVRYEIYDGETNKFILDGVLPEPLAPGQTLEVKVGKRIRKFDRPVFRWNIVSYRVR